MKTEIDKEDVYSRDVSKEGKAAKPKKVKPADPSADTLREEEGLNELSNGRVKSYLSKSHNSASKHVKTIIHHDLDKKHDAGHPAIQGLKKRQHGQDLAHKKLHEDEMTTEEKNVEVKARKNVKPGEDKFEILVNGKCVSTHPSESGAQKLAAGIKDGTRKIDEEKEVKEGFVPSVEKKDFFAFKEMASALLNTTKENILNQTKQNLQKSMFTEGAAETPGSVAMYDYHIDNMTIVDNETAEIVDFDDEEIESLAADIFDEEDKDDIEELTRESFDITLKESVLDDIKAIAASSKNSTIKFSNGQTSDIVSADAKIVVSYYKSLDTDKQKKYADMLDKNAKSFMLALNIAMGA